MYQPWFISSFAITVSLKHVIVSRGSFLELCESIILNGNFPFLLTNLRRKMIFVVRVSVCLSVCLSVCPDHRGVVGFLSDDIA